MMVTSSPLTLTFATLLFLCIGLLAFASAQINGPQTAFTANVVLQPQNVTATLTYDPMAKIMALKSAAHQTVTNFDSVL